jgi:hypothetical protein
VVDQTLLHCVSMTTAGQAAPRLWRLSDLYSAEHARNGSPPSLPGG